MFKSPDSRLSASNSAVLASESFLVPVTLHGEARTSQAAFDGLRQAFDEVSGFVTQLVSTAPGIALVPFSESISPKMSRVEVLLHGKEYRYDLTFALKCAIAEGAGLFGDAFDCCPRFMIGSASLLPDFTTGKALSFILRRPDLTNKKMIQRDCKRFANSRANHALRTRHGVVVCNRRVPCAGSLSLGLGGLDALGDFYVGCWLGFG